MKMRVVCAMIIALWAAATNADAQNVQTTPAASPFGAIQRVSGLELATIKGSADLSMIIAAKNSSDVSNNTISGETVTGGISFDQASLSNLSGLSVLSANTGNNVSINSSLNLNVAIRP